jgi:NAD(P)-dependent dehydrogenase (short-subunit alcohol dehydrogenase family)
VFAKAFVAHVGTTQEEQPRMGTDKKTRARRLRDIFRYLILLFIRVHPCNPWFFLMGVAIVTGGGRGIGKHIALRLARDGYDVALADLDHPELDPTALEIAALGRRTIAVRTDVTDEEQVRGMADVTLRVLGRIDVLVNNAGVVGPTAPVPDVNRAEWQAVLDVNLTGPFLCAAAVLPAMMRQRSGKVINIASIAGKIAYALRSPYAVSKWGLIGLTLTMAKEMAEHNIQVNAICPGPVAGPRMDGIIARRATELGQTTEEVTEFYLRSMALHRMVQPDDVANLVAYLASPAGDNITGQALEVTAGWGL